MSLPFKKKKKTPHLLNKYVQKSRRQALGSAYRNKIMSHGFQINLIGIENSFHSSFVVAVSDCLTDLCYNPGVIYYPNL